MKKILLFLFVSIYSITNGFSQNVTPFMGPTLKYSNNLYMPYVVGHDESGFYVSKLNKDFTLTLEKVSPSLEVITSQNIPTTYYKESGSLENYWYTSTGIVCLYSNYDKKLKTSTLYGRLIGKDCKFSTPFKELMTFKNINSPDEIYYSKIKSSDTSTFIVNIGLAQKNQPVTKLFWALFSNDLIKKSEFTTTINKPFETTSITLGKLDSKGNLFFSYSYEIKSNDNEQNKNLEEKHVLCYYNVNEQKISEFEILDDQFIISDFDMLLDADETHLYVVGLYSYKKSHFAAGSFCTKLNLTEKKLIYSVNTDFSKEFLNQFDARTFDENLFLNRNEIYNYKLHDVKLNSKNFISMLIEQSFETSSSNHPSTVSTNKSLMGYISSFNNIVTVEMNESGVMIEQIKYTKYQNIGYLAHPSDAIYYNYVSIGYIYYNSKYIVLYNDHKDNLNRLGINQEVMAYPFMIARRVMVGTNSTSAIYKKELYPDQKLKTVLVPKFTYQFNNNQISKRK
ncbi:MAG: hypothetical protein MUE33_00840 [Cytophagaceae bacterium]|nr:hypothetical protein [Cytophagaceae bacterium]